LEWMLCSWKNKFFPDMETELFFDMIASETNPDLFGLFFKETNYTRDLDWKKIWNENQLTEQMILVPENRVRTSLTRFTPPDTSMR